MATVTRDKMHLCATGTVPLPWIEPIEVLLLHATFQKNSSIEKGTFPPRKIDTCKYALSLLHCEDPSLVVDDREGGAFKVYIVTMASCYA